MPTNNVIRLGVLDAAIIEKVLPAFAPMNAKHFVGESCYDACPGPSSLKPLHHEDLEGRFFWWINRFVVGETTFEIAYGDREFLIEPTLFYAGIPDRFAPWELLSAAAVPSPYALSGETWVLDPDFIIRVVDGIADGLRRHWHILARPVPETIDRALVMRGKRMALAQEEQRRRDRERASMKASTAFHARRYAEAIRLLAPFKNDAALAPSAAKILKLSEVKLS